MTRPPKSDGLRGCLVCGGRFAEARSAEHEATPEHRREHERLFRCGSYTIRGTRCTRRATCVSLQAGWRYCAQHAREAEPRQPLWKS